MLNAYNSKFDPETQPHCDICMARKETLHYLLNRFIRVATTVYNKMVISYLIFWHDFNFEDSKHIRTGLGRYVISTKKEI